MRSHIAGIALLLAGCSSEPSPTATSSGDSRQGSDIECKGITDCVDALAELSQADDKMGGEFDRALARMRACERQNTTQCYGWDRAIELVRAEQETWLAWRTAHCETFAFSMEGTSAEGMLEAVCRVDLAKKRIVELQQIASPEGKQ